VSCFEIVVPRDIVLLAAMLPASAAQATHTPILINLGHEVVELSGPWKFQIGDDPHWSEPNFDDSAWESIDLTPSLGAHDSDVGLTGYVPGWQLRGHPGYHGYAWYRLATSVTYPKDESLALLGPVNVDSAYQIYVGGELLGGVGNFSRKTPVAYGTNKPNIYPLSHTESPMLIALRVWMGPWDLESPDSGGIHIAPSLGTESGVRDRYQLRWLQTIRGYIVDAVEPLTFVLLAIMTLSLIPFDRRNCAYPWLVASLMLLALARANQCVFYWGQVETVHGIELITVVTLTPLYLGAWTIAWSNWFRLRSRARMTAIVAVATLLHVCLQCLRASWFYGVFPHWFDNATSNGVMAVRLLFVFLTLIILLRGMSQSGREKWLAVSAVILLSIGLFAQELSMLRIPGIWFPFGTGVSRTQYAYAAFDVALFALLLQRLYALRGSTLSNRH
jgi:hypothetical protein